MIKDPYATLGVPKSASQDEIKAAYRNFAKKFHPDLNPGNKVAEAKFKDVALAYERIGNVEERTRFDRGETPEQQQEHAQRNGYEQDRSSTTSSAGSGPFSRHTRQEGGRYADSFGQAMGGDDFFENLFRSAGKNGGTNYRSGMSEDRPGQDHLYQMSVDFKDAALGAEREIELPNGKKLQVKIPPGVETGSKLRFKNQGAPGIGKGPNGDAYIEITVRSLPGFKRVGNNIESELSVSFIEALLGAEIKVPTIDGTVMLKIPSGVTTGSRLRVQGKGIALTKARGDQIVVLKIVMPSTRNSELESAVREWGDKYSYSPRVSI